MKHLFLISILFIFISGCGSNPPAPVESRSPQSNQPPPTSKSQPPTRTTSNEWRPDSYTVKKGDTLYSIGLNFGYDYREIAAANNIVEPYTIKIGQKLSFASLNNVQEPVSTEAPSSYENEDGVIISPIDTDGPDSTTVNTSVTTSDSAIPPTLSSPKATREPYSLEAYNRVPVETSPTPTPVTTAETLPEATPPVKDTPQVTTRETATIEGISWSWPTQGKVIGRFNQSTNKGIDIAGDKGQAITASSAGKVIYAGSDLRGYGKLVIIKHNTTFLSVYAHNSKIDVKEGQSIKAGQKIAEMGDTDTNRIKLHFEIRQKGKSVDPEKFLPQN